MQFACSANIDFPFRTLQIIKETESESVGPTHTSPVGVDDGESGASNVLGDTSVENKMAVELLCEAEIGGDDGEPGASNVPEDTSPETETAVELPCEAEIEVTKSV